MKLAISIFYDGKSFGGALCSRCSLAYGNIGEHSKLCTAVAPALVAGLSVVLQAHQAGIVPFQLIDLMIKYHSVDATIVCPHCKFIFKTRESLCAHIEFCVKLSSYSPLQQKYAELAFAIVNGMIYCFCLN